MMIYSEIVQQVLNRCTFEYSGTHNSDPKNPLWGRRAYWRVFVPGYGFACKITAPVKSINPKEETLARLLKAELTRRFQAVGMVCDTDHYGQVSAPRMVDPYSVLPLLNSVQGKYMGVMQREQSRKVGAV